MRERECTSAGLQGKKLVYECNYPSNMDRFRSYEEIVVICYGEL